MENKRIYLWIQHYKDIALSLFPIEHRFENIFREQMIGMSTGGVVCFRRLVGVVPNHARRWDQVE